MFNLWRKATRLAKSIANFLQSRGNSAAHINGTSWAHVPIKINQIKIQFGSRPTSLVQLGLQTGRVQARTSWKRNRNHFLKDGSGSNTEPGFWFWNHSSKRTGIRFQTVPIRGYQKGGKRLLINGPIIRIVQRQETRGSGLPSWWQVITSTACKSFSPVDNKWSEALLVSHSLRWSYCHGFVFQNFAETKKEERPLSNISFCKFPLSVF